MTQQHVRGTVEDGTMWVTIDRPEAKNALTKRMYAQIRDLFRAAYLDDDVRAVVIQGSVGAFAVGGDLKEVLSSVAPRPGPELFEYDECLPFEAVRSLPKPTIAAVDGLCMGGGLTLALLCDIVVATERSRFAMPESKVGVVDAHMPRLLRDEVAPARLRYWLYTGVTFSASQAMEGGLLTEVVGDGDLERATERILGELGQASPDAIRAYKKILNETRPLASMEDAYEVLVTDEARQRLEGFGRRD